MRCRSKRTRTKPSGATAEAGLIAFEVDGDARRGDRSYIFPDLDVVGMRPVCFEICERIEPGDERKIVGRGRMQHVGSGGDRADFRDQRGKTFEFFFDNLADGAMRRADFRFRLEFPSDKMRNHDRWLLFSSLYLLFGAQAGRMQGMAVMKFYNVSDFEEGDIFRTIIPHEEDCSQKVGGENVAHDVARRNGTIIIDMIKI